jgi:3-hydroxyisobutyrate dehydrogenase-like beta-hydroxyacid dehydrogenase
LYLKKWRRANERRSVKEGIYMETIGFIGIGNMGRPMSSRLIEHGYKLVAHDIRSEAMAQVVAKGATAAKSPRDVAEKARIVIMSLPTPEVVEDVVLGPNGIIRGAGSDSIVIELSTTGPKVVQKIDNAFREKGIKLLDAPVSGGAWGAERGTLSVMAAGDEGVFQTCRDILGIIGNNVFYLGANPGIGQVMKLMNNLLSCNAIAATIEVMVLGVKAGLDPEKALEVLNVSTGRNTATLEKFPRFILPRTFNSGFALEFTYKDLRLAIEMAEFYGVPMFLGNMAKQIWGYAVSRGGGKKDNMEIIKYIEEWVGVEVKGRGKS